MEIGQRLSSKGSVLVRLLWLVVLGIPVATFLDLFGVQIGCSLDAKWMARKAPEINVVPQPLADTAISSDTGTTLSYFGYSFEVPWTGIPKERVVTKQETGLRVVVLTFPSGQVIIFWAPVTEEGIVSEIAGEFKSQHGPDARHGGLLDSSPYAQYAALLNVAPSQIAPFGPRNAAQRTYWLLFFKAFALPPGLETGAYSLQTSALHGFQIGNPARSPRVLLRLFDIADHYSLEFSCAVDRDGPVKLTQPEINRIIQTVRPIANPQSRSAKSHTTHPPSAKN